MGTGVLPKDKTSAAEQLGKDMSGMGLFFHSCLLQYNEYALLKKCIIISLFINILTGGRGGSIGRASASRSNGPHDQRLESRPEHKKNL